jgi:tetratricopeptide (TPR) repeat protein
VSPHDPEKNAESAEKRGMSFLREKKYDQARASFREAADLYASLSDLSGQIRMLQFSADLSLSTDREGEALELYGSMIGPVRERGDARREAFIHNNIGLILSRRDRYRDALESFMRSLSLFESLGDQLQVAAQWGNIGSVYRDMEKLEDALESYRRALPIYRSLAHDEGIGDQLTNIAYIHFQRGERNAALKMYRDALPRYEKAGAEKKLRVTRRNVENLENQGS